MRFWRSPIGALTIVLALAAGLGFGVTLVLVHRQTTPSRTEPEPLDFESMTVGVGEVRFEAADGVRLAGWLFPGRPGQPPVVLCHDLGENRASLVNLAIALQKQGFPVLAFDFRGHGRSAGERSTLGLREKRDVIGAIDHLATLRGLETRRIGVYGVGMGAHAAVLAAADRPSVRVLVLDALYPDVSWPLVHGVYRDWPFAAEHLGFVARGAFIALAGTGAGGERAEAVIGDLLGRDLLLVAPAGDARLAGEIERMYHAVPEQADADGNLVVLPATHGDGLFAEQLTLYHERVLDFFGTRLVG